MRQLTRDRIRLIRAIEKAIEHRAGSYNVDDLERPSWAECTCEGCRLWRLVYWPIRRDERGDFLSFSQDDPGKVSYASKPEFRFDSDRRTKTTLARYIRRRLEYGPDQIFDKDLACLVSQVFGLVSVDDSDTGFRLVKGEDISQAYDSEFGGHSCMTSENSGLVELYEINPDKVELLKYERNGYKARAIVWTFDNGAKAIDRIYPNSGPHIDAIIEWAKRKGYDFKTSHGMGCYQFASGNTYEIELKCGDIFPYLDTLQFGEVMGDGTVILSNSSSGWPHEFSHTDGTYYDEGGCAYCYNCGRGIDLSDCRTDPDGYGYCDSCFYEYYAVCENCHETVSIDYASHTQDGMLCEECYNESYAECSECSECLSFDDLTMVEGFDYVCDDCLETLKEDGKIVECSCGELHENKPGNVWFIEDMEGGFYTCEDPYKDQIRLAI